MTARRDLALVLAVIAVATALAACGKRNPPKPPDDRKAEYTYPRFYPAPATVLPTGADATVDPVENERLEEQPIRRLSPVPDPNRTRTRTYGPFSR